MLEFVKGLQHTIMNKPPTPHESRAAERRTGRDRRIEDRGPPGKHERRRGIESRKPDVVEREMSDSEWTALTAPPPKTAPKPAPKK